MVASDGTPVTLWAREGALVDEINQRRTNATYLPGVTIAPSVRATCDMGELAGLETILVVCPAQFMGAVLSALPDAPRDLVLCSKGIEAGTGRLMADVAKAASLRPASPFCPARPLPAKWPLACPPRSRWPVRAARNSGSACRQSSPVQLSVRIIRPMWWAPKSAGR
jgi:hypothetical protein